MLLGFCFLMLFGDILTFCDVVRKKAFLATSKKLYFFQNAAKLHGVQKEPHRPSYWWECANKKSRNFVEVIVHIKSVNPENFYPSSRENGIRVGGGGGGFSYLVIPKIFRSPIRLGSLSSENISHFKKCPIWFFHFILES